MMASGFTQAPGVSTLWYIPTILGCFFVCGWQLLQ